MTPREAAEAALCSDCPPVGYPTDETRCAPCPRRPPLPAAPSEPAEGQEDTPVAIYWREQAHKARADLARMKAAMGKAAEDVIAERERQKTVEGWTVEHDDNHVDGTLARAGACYALTAGREHFNAPTHEDSGWEDIPAPFAWPWSRDWWKPKGRRQNLVRAGALILAEIERLDRDA